MPVDYGDQQWLHDFIEQLGCLEGILSSADFDSCICIGDFNTNLNSDRRRFTRILRTFMNEKGLQISRLASLDNSRTSWTSADFRYSSWIDYVRASYK